MNELKIGIFSYQPKNKGFSSKRQSWDQTRTANLKGKYFKIFDTKTQFENYLTKGEVADHFNFDIDKMNKV